MDAAPLVTICIVTGRRIPLLDACLASLQEQVDPPPFELLVCSDGDAEVAQAVRARFPDGPHPLGRARLSGRGAQRPPRRRARRVAAVPRRRRDRATRPAGAGSPRSREAHPDGRRVRRPERLARRAAPASSSCRARPWRRWPAPVRCAAATARIPPGPADERFFILCNLAVRRSAMLPFDPDLVCAEENALLSEMSRRGIEMHYDPELAVFHERRDTFSGFGRQMYKYGRGRGQLMVRTPATASPAYLVPSALHRVRRVGADRGRAHAWPHAHGCARTARGVRRGRRRRRGRDRGDAAQADDASARRRTHRRAPRLLRRRRAARAHRTAPRGASSPRCRRGST